MSLSKHGTAESLSDIGGTKNENVSTLQRILRNFWMNPSWSLIEFISTSPNKAEIAVFPPIKSCEAREQILQSSTPYCAISVLHCNIQYKHNWTSFATTCGWMCIRYNSQNSTLRHPRLHVNNYFHPNSQIPILRNLTNWREPKTLKIIWKINVFEENKICQSL